MLMTSYVIPEAALEDVPPHLGDTELKSEKSDEPE